MRKPKTTNHYANFDGMTWPRISAGIGDIEWALRYGEPTREEVLVAASVLNAYRALIKLGRVEREAIVRVLRSVEKAQPPPPKVDAETLKDRLGPSIMDQLVANDFSKPAQKGEESE